MSNYSDEPYEEDDYPPEESTRPLEATPPRPTRRRLPADDLPPVNNRPALPRDPEPRPARPKPTAAAPRTPRYPIPEPPVIPTPAQRKRSSRSTTPARQRNKRDSGLYLPWWSLVIMLAFVGAAAVGAWLIVNQLGGTAAPGGTPVVIVITATYTIGPPASTTPIPQAPTLTGTAPLPTIVPSVTYPPGIFAIGAKVKVIGVGTSGLNVRSGPGRDATVKFQAAENEVFQLRESPQLASGDEWWFIQDPKDQNRGGWASRQYLQVLSP